MVKPPEILCCSCSHYHLVAESAVSCITASLCESGLDVCVTDDLCGLAATKDQRLAAYLRGENVHVVACYPRAVKWLFHRSGNPLGDGDVTFHNARTDDADTIISSVMDSKGVSGGLSGARETIQDDSSWIPWYPVIDYDRCVNCRQCLDFCLFGVYTQSDEGRVEVSNPKGCKTNCPACSRLCPQSAIIFPKYEHSPINGDEVDESAVDKQKDHSELEALLGGDIHEILRKRKAKKSLFAVPEASDTGLSTQEKILRLSEMQRQLDIPQEVLDSLSRERTNGAGANDTRRLCPNMDICPGDCEKRGGEHSG